MTALRGGCPIKEVVLITSGDLRQSANRVCWPAQEELERKLTQCFLREGVIVRRAFPVDAHQGHGFISSQRMGMDIFEGIDPAANLVFATAAWQYSHHVLPGMRSHKGPILTVANWSGTTLQWPMVSAVFDGVTRDQFMARHRANHVNIAYANDDKSAIHALAVKSAMFHSLGVQVHVCGKVPLA